MHDRCGGIWNFSACGVISNFSTWEMQRKLKFFHMLSDFKFLHMTDVKKSEVSPYQACMWRMSIHMYMSRYFVEKLVLSWFTLFCRKICFVAIYAFLCGEKFNQRLRMWRKNDKYQVWYALFVRHLIRVKSHSA